MEKKKKSDYKREEKKD